MHFTKILGYEELQQELSEKPTPQRPEYLNLSNQDLAGKLDKAVFIDAHKQTSLATLKDAAYMTQELLFRSGCALNKYGKVVTDKNTFVDGIRGEGSKLSLEKFYNDNDMSLFLPKDKNRVTEGFIKHFNPTQTELTITPTPAPIDTTGAHAFIIDEADDHAEVSKTLKNIKLNPNSPIVQRGKQAGYVSEESGTYYMNIGTSGNSAYQKRKCILSHELTKYGD